MIPHMLKPCACGISSGFMLLGGAALMDILLHNAKEIVGTSRLPQIALWLDGFLPAPPCLMGGAALFATGYCILASREQLSVMICVLHGLLGVLMLLIAIAALPLVRVEQGLGETPASKDSCLPWFAVCSLPLGLAGIQWMHSRRKFTTGSHKQ